jgi:hypothetical protein
MEFNKTSSIFLKIAAFSTTTLAIISLWTFYKNNIWFPKVILKDVDYSKGEANLEVNNKPFFLQGNSEYGIGSSYGIKFGSTNTNDGKQVYDRIEISKDGLVKSIVSKIGDTTKSFTANERTYYNDTFNGFVLK